jgi:serine-type D-Ala-D-Ala carboxypeptidase/endopeptidase (penicillin-binding protein 4)
MGAIAIGALIIGILLFIPYRLSFIDKLPQFVSFQPEKTAKAEEEQKKIIAEPIFDAAVWYLSNESQPEKHGVLIENFDGDRVLAALNEDTVFNPASVTKLATSLIALRKLGSTYRFQTRVYIDGNIEPNGNLKGTLYVVGTDPTFGDIGANAISKELKERGIKRIAGELKVSSEFSFNFSEKPEDSAQRLSKGLRLGSPKLGVAETIPSNQPAFTFKSYELKDLLLYMNAHSSNFVAERIVKLVGGPEALRAFLVNEIRLPSDQVVIETASGLGHNRLTPRGIITIIRKLVEEAKIQGLQPENIMPVAHADVGTLRRRFAGTGLEGAVVAKTGTLGNDDGGMASLAGLVYTSNKQLVLFAMLDQGKELAVHRQLQDRLLTEVVTSFSTPTAITSLTPRQLLPPSSLSVDTRQ